MIMGFNGVLVLFCVSIFSLNIAYAKSLLPNYSLWKSDYYDSTSGTAANPISLFPCIYVPVDWQVMACSDDASRVYSNSNHSNFTNGSENYWVAGMNIEPAYDASIVSGPPNQSAPIDGEKYGVFPSPNGFTLRISHQSAPANEIPFLSIGYQKGRGAISPKMLGTTKYIEFDATLKSDSNLPGTQNSVHFWIETESPNGEKLFSWLFLYERGTGSNTLLKWNWPVRESMWYPGAQIKFWTADQIPAYCNTPIEPLVPNVRKHIRINVVRLIACSFGLKNTKLTGFHFAVEQSNYNTNVTEATFENIELYK